MGWIKIFRVEIQGAFAVRGSQGSDLASVEVNSDGLTVEQARDLAAALNDWADEKERHNSR